MRFFAAILACIIAIAGKAQLLSWTPDFIQESSATIEITCDATLGNKALQNYANSTDVYVHIGAITSSSTSSSDWKYVKFTWGTTTSAAQCTYLGSNKWKYTITGGLRGFFGITNATETIKKIAILFRNGAGAIVQRNADGTDMYVSVYDNNLAVRIDQPLRQPTYVPSAEPITKNIGDNIAITAKANTSAALTLFFNGTQISTAANSTTITANPSITTAGTQTIIAQATVGTTTTRDTVSFFVASATVVQDPPTGMKEGINYEAGDTSAILLLYAPNKTRISVIGDFNNWIENSNYQMYKTTDGTKFWLRIKGLTPGAEYAYQYLIDGSLKVADYNTEKILDPNNDQYIPSSTYPNLKAYPTGKTTGIVSILQTAKPSYTFTSNTYTRPDKRNLLVYELLVRDFTAAKNWNTLRDTLSYLKRLGVNAIELMPFNEFEGNNSWGYNPSFYFAPDKYYGTENALKIFIDSCHKIGMAVIMDIAMNHSFGQSPMVQMYWDATNSAPAANSPWFNQAATHPYNVGYDFNHESAATKNFVDRVVEFWLTKYKIDGFRWDLSKGFTQTNNPNDVNAWSAYDASRIAIWKRIYDKMQSVSNGSYCILEHFAANTEEIELSNYGMLLWGNANYNFNEATMGYVSTSNFSGIIHTARGWSNPYLIGYQESHDEERLMYKNINFGNANANYSTKDLNTALKRNEMATAFWAMTPGPKMLWQFGELGYDFSINTCENGTIDNNCRVSPKPIKWDYYQNANRKQLYDVYAKLLRARNMSAYLNAFTTNNISYNLTGAFKTMIVSDASLKIVVIGNFDINAQTASVIFPSAGTWYSYLTGTTKAATGNAENITLQPGEYYVYTDKDLSGNVATPIFNVNGYLANTTIKVFPNPATIQSMVQYELEESGMVNIELLDISGKKVGQVFDGYKAKGKYTQPLNATGSSKSLLSTGVYMIRLSLNGKQKTEKFIINN